MDKIKEIERKVNESLSKFENGRFNIELSMKNDEGGSSQAFDLRIKDRGTETTARNLSMAEKSMVKSALADAIRETPEYLQFLQFLNFR